MRSPSRTEDSRCAGRTQLSQSSARSGGPTDLGTDYALHSCNTPEMFFSGMFLQKFYCVAVCNSVNRKYSSLYTHVFCPYRARSEKFRSPFVLLLETIKTAEICKQLPPIICLDFIIVGTSGRLSFEIPRPTSDLAHSQSHLRESRYLPLLLISSFSILCVVLFIYLLL
jgi:hypothetical protein